MQKKDIITLSFLIGLTILTAIFSQSEGIGAFLPLIILVLSGIKFLLVAFNFMELKKANAFWKTIMIVYVVIFVAIVTIIISNSISA